MHEQGQQHNDPPDASRVPVIHEHAAPDVIYHDCVCKGSALRQSLSHIRCDYIAMCRDALWYIFVAGQIFDLTVSLPAHARVIPADAAGTRAEVNGLRWKINVSSAQPLRSGPAQRGRAVRIHAMTIWSMKVYPKPRE